MKYINKLSNFLKYYLFKYFLLILPIITWINEKFFKDNISAKNKVGNFENIDVDLHELNIAELHIMYADDYKKIKINKYEIHFVKNDEKYLYEKISFAEDKKLRDIFRVIGKNKILIEENSISILNKNKN